MGALIVGNYVLKGRTLKNLIFLPGQVEGIQFQGANPMIQFSVIVQNTSSIGITLQSIAGNVYTDDSGKPTLIGNISNFQPVLIAPNSQTIVVVNCLCRIVGIINEVISAFQYKNRQKVLTVQAFANIDGIQFSVPEFSIAVGV